MKHHPLPVFARLLALWLGLAAVACAAEGVDAEAADSIAEQVQRFADDASRAVSGNLPGRIEVRVGQLDGRLRLAPCERIEPYLPRGTRLWGRAHIGVRCLEGRTRWNVYLPITVSVYARALVAGTLLPAGSTIGPGDLTEGEVDLAAEPGAVIAHAEGLLGRTLVRSVDAGEAFRASQLKARQWFAAGDTVRLNAVGGGFAVSVSGQALTPGFEGQTARIRTDSGRVVNGIPVGLREAEVPL